MIMLTAFQNLLAIVKFLAVLLLVYAAYCAFMFVVQRSLIYPRGFIGRVGEPDTERLGVEPIWLDTDYGRIETWYLPPDPLPDRGSPAPTVIFAHGNAELIDDNVELMRPLQQLGLAVLLVEYPGYGRSSGRPSQKSITAAFLAAYDMLLARQLADPDNIILYGRSLGSGAVCALAARRPSAGLILMSAYTSLRAFAIRYGAPGFLVRDPFDNLSVIKDYPGPVLIAHGKYDNVIPFRHGLKLHEAAPDSIMIAYDCAHNDCPPDWEHYNDRLADFIQSLLNTKA